MRWDALFGVRLTREQMEERRLRAGDDLKAGMKQADVARKYSVSTATVCRWVQTIRDEGMDGLKMSKATGQPSKLDEEEQQQLVEILIKGPRAYVWKTDLWNSKRVTEVIRKEFGVTYHPHHMPKLLHRLGFRPVKPKRRATEKNEKRKQEWLNTTWVQVKKN